MNNPYDPDPDPDPAPEPPSDYRLSMERERALREVGFWDDAVLRERYRRLYWRYDQGLPL